MNVAELTYAGLRAKPSPTRHARAHDGAGPRRSRSTPIAWCSASAPSPRRIKRMRGARPGTTGCCSGVPLAVKDVHDFAGEVTAYGTVAHGPRRAHGSELVRRLHRAGRSPSGKTTRRPLAARCPRRRGENAPCAAPARAAHACALDGVVPSAALHASGHARTSSLRRLGSVLERHDVLLMPTTAVSAAEVGALERLGSVAARFLGVCWPGRSRGVAPDRARSRAGRLLPTRPARLRAG
jgi:Asp-tRNA(Asn)/Glu-tRNA(Gln) amidotransferase A subunit family amidase